MAGLGRKIFTAGDVLTASDVQSYLMDQTVMNFAGTAARSSAIATPTEGMVTYLADTNAVEVYDGSAYVGVGGGGLVFLNETTFSAQTSVSLPTDTFTSTYSNYRIIVSFSAVSATTGVNVRFRTAGTDNTGASYMYFSSAFNSSTGAETTSYARSQTSAILGAAASIPGNFSMDVIDPKNALYTTLTGSGVYTLGNTVYSGLSFNAATVFDSMTFIASTGNFTGVVRAYGYAE